MPDTGHLEDYINGLTEKTSPDTSNDMFLIRDSTDGSMKKISPKYACSMDGWISSASMVYASADAPSYVVTMTGDQSGIYQAGQKIKLTLDNSTRYFIITKVETSGSTALTLYGGTDYVISASPITNPYYSMMKAPFGFPLNLEKWTVSVTDSVNRQQATPTQNIWYNNAVHQIYVPIGCWKISYRTCLYPQEQDNTSSNLYVTLATSNNSCTDSDMTHLIYYAQSGTHPIDEIGTSVYTEKTITLTSKTTYYLNMMTTYTNVDAINIFSSSTIGTTIKAESTYL